MREAYVGFDSAWAGKVPGGIVWASFEYGKFSHCTTPQLTGFDGAAALIRELHDEHDYVLIAMDQPTVVPNMRGMRPVERVAGSLLGRLGGGVQPANRSRVLFNANAPVWQFLDQIGARQCPSAARDGEPGLHLIEVFPALALTALVPQILARKRAARYNPANRRFSLADWQLVCNTVARHACTFELLVLSGWADGVSQLTKPAKNHQDQLDAVVCLIVALQWRRLVRDKLALIGDVQQGYMVTPVTRETKTILKRAADEKAVSFYTS